MSRTDMIRTHGYDPRGPGADRRYGNIPDTATRDAVADALEEARQAWRDWKDAWSGVQRAMRSAGMSTARIDAYRVGTGYDEGGGRVLVIGGEDSNGALASAEVWNPSTAQDERDGGSRCDD